MGEPMDAWSRIRGWVGASIAATLLSACASGPPKPLPPPPTPTPVPALRLPPRGLAVVDFERVSGRVVEAEGGTATLFKNAEKAIWGGYAGEIRFRPRRPGPQAVRLLPREPWVAPSVFNLVTLWVWDNGVAGLRPDHTLVVHALDAQENPHSWELPYTPSDAWQMLHLHVAESLPGPLRVTELEWRMPDSHPGQERTLFLEELRIVQEPYSRIPQNQYYQRPHEYVPPYVRRATNTVGLDFPPGPHAFRPVPPSRRHLRLVRRGEGETHHFLCEDEGGSLEYRVTPRPGAPEIQVWFNGEEWPAVWSGFGVDLAGGVTPHPRFARLEDDVLTLQYSEGLRYELRLEGRTLQIDAFSLSETVEAWRLGELGGSDAGDALPLFVPFLRLSEDRPWPLLVLRRNDSQLLVSCFPDWWYSLAGRHEPAKALDPRAEPLGRMCYPSRWKGARNTFRERVYLTVAERLTEVLPGPSAPVAMNRDLLKSVSRRSRPDDGTRLEPLRLLPTDPLWQEDRLARTEQGAWIPHPSAGFLQKTGRLMGEPLAQTLRDFQAAGQDRLHVGAAALLPPWASTDFDARMTGAGTFAQTWAELGVFYQQLGAEAAAPLVSRGGSEWLLAGFFAGIEPSFSLGIDQLHPFLPQLAWRHLHPSSALLGLGDLRDFRFRGEDDPGSRVLVERMLATQVAYAAFSGLPEIHDPDLDRMAHRLLEPLARRLASSRCERVSYWNGFAFVDAAEVLRQEQLHLSQLYIRLDDQTEIWVNGHARGDWPLRVGDLQPVLPPFGFVVRSGDLLVLRAAFGGADALSAVVSPGEFWLYSPDRPQEFMGARVHGDLRILRAREGHPVRVEVRQRGGEVWIPEALLALGPRDVHVYALDPFGTPLPQSGLLRGEGGWLLPADALSDSRVFLFSPSQTSSGTNAPLSPSPLP